MPWTPNYLESSNEYSQAAISRRQQPLGLRGRYRCWDHSCKHKPQLSQLHHQQKSSILSSKIWQEILPVHIGNDHRYSCVHTLAAWTMAHCWLATYIHCNVLATLRLFGIWLGRMRTSKGALFVNVGPSMPCGATKPSTLASQLHPCVYVGNTESCTYA